MTPDAIAAAAMIATPIVTIRLDPPCLLLLWCFIGWLLLRSGHACGAWQAPSRRVSCCYLLRLGTSPDAFAGSHQGRHHVKLHATQDLCRPVRMPAELVHPERQA